MEDCLLFICGCFLLSLDFLLIKLFSLLKSFLAALFLPRNDCEPEDVADVENDQRGEGAQGSLLNPLFLYLTVAEIHKLAEQDGRDVKQELASDLDQELAP
mmetsp:Transcript_21882/g.29291  ORF Transcript_21882/g.29291 Transcript_21882/m.29291 type:complete len:101 (-) Transcript_21882:1166-1468(-)